MSTTLAHIAEPLRPLAMPIGDINPDAANARRHPERNLEAIVASLSRFGQRHPVVVQKQGMVCRAGNGRLEAAKKLGWTHIAAVVVDESSVEATAFAIADNRTADLAEWDDETLASLLDTLPADLRDAAGYSEGELGSLLDSLRPAVTEDEAPEPLPEPVSRTGDLWECGGHRVLCGDSTKAEDVRLVMAGGRAALMNTDPPYGIAYDNAALGPSRREYAALDNDERTGAQSQAFLEAVFRAAVAEALAENAAWYLWHAMLSQGFFAAAAAAAANVVLHRQIIWVKPRLILGRGQYHWRHELCFMGWVDGHQPPDYGRGSGERDQTTVWEIDGVSDADRREYEHATPKPVELFSIPLVKHTKAGEACYEPFCGSGAQLVAAEQLGRKCYAIEIEPRYVDVAVRRWQALTSKAGTLNGRTFAEVAEERGVSWS